MKAEKPKPSALFILVFIAVLLAVSAGVYMAFSNYQRGMAGVRRAASAKNLGAIGSALRAFAEKNGGAFPDRSARLMPDFLRDETALTHPAWPELPGYVYVPGVKPGDAAHTLLVYENVPERKRKLGIQVLLLNGEIQSWTEAECMEKLKTQENEWKRTGRVWLPEEMMPPR